MHHDGRSYIDVISSVCFDRLATPGGHTGGHGRDRWDILLSLLPCLCRKLGLGGVPPSQHAESCGPRRGCLYGGRGRAVVFRHGCKGYEGARHILRSCSLRQSAIIFPRRTRIKVMGLASLLAKEVVGIERRTASEVPLARIRPQAIHRHRDGGVKLSCG